MVGLRAFHHIAIICSDYERSKNFYSKTLGLEILEENYRSDRSSWKLDMALPSGARIELFSFPDPPERQSRPEARGLRHLAFSVDNIEASKSSLEALGVLVEAIRVDEHTGKRFAFFKDPDNLPLELYEV